MTDSRSPITTHVLDTARGRPAVGVPVKLHRVPEFDPSTDHAPDHEDPICDPIWELLGTGTTDLDGRVTDLLRPGSLRPGVHRFRFDTGVYFKHIGTDAYFYPWAEIVFVVHEPAAHYHVPLLLNPFGYSTYRGS